MKYCGDKITDSHDKEMPNESSDFTCLAVINAESALKKDEHY